MTAYAPGKEILNDTDLREHWVSLMGEYGFEMRSLWLVFIEHDRRVAPVVVPIDDIPEEPDEDSLAQVAVFVERAREELDVASVPMLLSRPGSGEMTTADRRWAKALTTAFRDQPHQWPIHLATHHKVQVFAPDDLV